MISNQDEICRKTIGYHLELKKFDPNFVEMVQIWYYFLVAVLAYQGHAFANLILWCLLLCSLQDFSSSIRKNKNIILDDASLEVLYRSLWLTKPASCCLLFMNLVAYHSWKTKPASCFPDYWNEVPWSQSYQ